jgi:predicted DNA-binding protein with PD1-like motif
MKYSEARYGRIFVIRLEDGDILHETIELFAKKKGIRAATLIILGGADTGSRLVVGPKKGRELPVNPVTRLLDGVHEVTGTGTIFPDEQGKPVLHMHIACGRGAKTVTGCVRTGVKTWHVLEAVLFELKDTKAVRVRDRITGFELLRP